MAVRKSPAVIKAKQPTKGKKPEKVQPGPNSLPCQSVSRKEKKKKGKRGKKETRDKETKGSTSAKLNQGTNVCLVISTIENVRILNEKEKKREREREREREPVAQLFAVSRSTLGWTTILFRRIVCLYCGFLCIFPGVIQRWKNFAAAHVVHQSV